MKSTLAAGLELAVLALEDEPVRAGLADTAAPEEQRVGTLDHGEGVVAVAWDGHFDSWVWAWCGEFVG